MRSVGASLAATAPPTGAALAALRLHVADTVVAGKAGALAGTAGLLPEPAGGLPLPDRIGRLAAHIRSTEIDDIHRAACVTPGSVAVPVALGLLSAGLTGPEAVLPSIQAGYGAMVGFGLAFNASRVLYRGIWPTHAIAPLGAAAAAGRALGLDAVQLDHALSLACSAVTGRVGHAGGPRTARWLLFSEAVRAGVAAALAAARGYEGEPGLWAGAWSTAWLGAPPDFALLSDTIEAGEAVRSTSFKPWCAAKQTTAAIAAFRSVLDELGNAAAIDAVDVFVPPAYAGMIGLPVTRDDDRLATITSVAYQIGLAAARPERLHDVARLPLEASSDARRIAACVSVHADDTLAGYPDAWPAEVRVSAGGRLLSRRVVHAPGDPERPFSTDDLMRKAADVLPPDTAATLEPLFDASLDPPTWITAAAGALGRV